MAGVKRILREIRLGKIAAVDFPCQEGANAMIIKRSDPDLVWKTKYDTDARKEMADNGEAMKDGSYPIKDGADLEHAIHAVGRGKNNSHTAIRDHIKARAKALGLESKLPETWTDGEKLAKSLCAVLRKGGMPGLQLSESDEDEGAETFDDALSEQQLTNEFWTAYYQGTQALEGSLLSILKDDTVTDKTAPIAVSISQFADYIEQIMPGQIGKSLAKTVTALAGLSEPVITKGVPMSDELKKSLGLPATATEAEVTKAVARLDAIAKMSGKHKDFMDHKDAKMPKGGKDAFAEMSSDERDAHMKSNPIEGDEPDIAKALAAGEAFRTLEGAVIHKRAVGDATFSVLKSQNDRLIKQEADLAKARDREEENAFAKRAADIGLMPVAGAMFRKAYAGDVKAQMEVESLIKGLIEQADTGALFKNFGHNNAVDDSASAEFMAKVADVKKANPNLTDAQAYSRAYTAPANRDIVKRMRTEAA